MIVFLLYSDAPTINQLIVIDMNILLYEKYMYYINNK